MISLGNFSIVHPLWLLPAGALGIAALFWRPARHPDNWHRVLSAPVLAYLQPLTKSSRQPNALLLVMTLVCAALASPSIQSNEGTALRHAQAWIIVVDVSRSMSLADISPYRLAAARDIAIEIARRAGPRATALLAFSGDAHLLVPPSFERAQLYDLSAALKPELFQIAGSDLTRALSLTASVIDDSRLSSARIFLLSDGGGISAAVRPIATQFAARGHRLDVLLFADPLTRDPVTLDFKAAEALADAGDGQLVLANALGQTDLASIGLLDSLDSDAMTEITDYTVTSWHNQSHWLLLTLVPWFALRIWRGAAQ